MKFQGDYVPDIKSLLIASAVSGQNAVLVGEPGWGKTHMALTAAHAVAGKAGTIFLEFDPSTPPEVIRGSYNPAALLDGRLERVFTDTPYDPRAKVVICDELFRTNDIVFDAFIHVTESKTRPRLSMPVFWATANHVAEYDRVEALRDRFALWMYLKVGKPDVKNIVKTHLDNGVMLEDPSWKAEFPTWQDCMDIRKSKPGKDQVNLIADFVNAVAKESYNCGFEINPRRIVQWSSILYCYSMYIKGVANFDEIPHEAMVILSYAYPNINAEKAASWKKAVMALVDKAGAALSEVVTNIKTNLEKLVSEKPQYTREKYIAASQHAVEVARADLDAIKNDPRADKLKEDLAQWASAIQLGGTPGLDFLGVEL